MQWGRRILGTDKVYLSWALKEVKELAKQISGTPGKGGSKCKGIEAGTLPHAVLSTAEDMKMKKLKELKIM